MEQSESQGAPAPDDAEMEPLPPSRYSHNYPVYCDWAQGADDIDEDAPRKKYRGPPEPIRDATKERYREALEQVLAAMRGIACIENKLRTIREICTDALAYVPSTPSVDVCNQCHKVKGHLTMGGRCRSCHMLALEPRFYQ